MRKIKKLILRSKEKKINELTHPHMRKIKK